MRGSARHLIAVVLASALCVPAIASGVLAEGPISFETISMRDGLPQTAISAIVQDQQGFLWLATQFGLARYDGHQMIIWGEGDGATALADNHVTDMAVADAQHLWVATPRVLHRFNTETGESERFKAPLRADQVDRIWSEMRIVGIDTDGCVVVRFGPDLLGKLDPDSDRVELLPLPEGSTRSPELGLRADVLIDGRGRIWSHSTKGLKTFDEFAGMMRLVLPQSDRNDWPHTPLALTPAGDLMLGDDTGLRRFDPITMQVVDHWYPTAWGAETDQVIAVKTDTYGGVWVGQSDTLFRFDLATETVTDFTFLSPSANQNLEFFIGQLLESEGSVWVSTPHGLLHWQPEQPARAKVYRHDPARDTSIPSTTTVGSYRLFVDRDRTFWVAGHLGGLARQSPYARRFELIRDSGVDRDRPFVGQNIVRAILETPIDEGGEHIWLGLNGAGIRQFKRNQGGQLEWLQSFYQGADHLSQQLANNDVWALAHDPLSDMIWVGMSHALAVIDRRTATVVNQYTAEVLGTRIHTGLTFESNGPGLYVTSTERLTRWTLTEDRRAIELSEPPQKWFVDQELRAMYWGVDGELVVVGGAGMGVLDTGRDQAHWFPLSQWSSQSEKLLFGLAPHHQRGWWVGGRDSGLAHVVIDFAEPAPQVTAQWYDREAGLVDETVYAILPEPKGLLWISSNRGLLRWDPNSLEGVQFLERDGIQAHEFNNTVAHIGPSGRFYFGGINGANAFYPEQIMLQQPPTDIALTALSVNGERIPTAQASPLVLNLPYDQNALDFSFVALHTTNPRFNEYAYRLQGLNASWIEAGSLREARFVGLRPGQYQFEVRAANSDGLWSQPVLLAQITISPPWYSTLSARVAYLILLLLAILTLAQWQRRRRLHLEALVAQRTQELNDSRDVLAQRSRDLERALKARTEMFANVSHEFRTPLTLIQASLKKMAKTGAKANAVQLAERHLQRMIRMVEQMLDLARIHATEATAAHDPWSISEVARMVVRSFADIAESRDIELAWDIDSRLETHCNQEQVEKIILNLLSNALKFTLPGGRVVVSLKASNNGVLLTVSDTGPGIPAEDQALIFERFYRSAMHQDQAFTGAGIGLALVKESAEANGGHVSVDSQIGVGASFKVWLPAKQAAGPMPLPKIRNAARSELELGVFSSEHDEVDQQTSKTDVTSDDTMPTLLIVEDDADLRAHLVEVLCDQWRCVAMADGRAGLLKARQIMPDVVLTDLMMPGMDGFQMLERLRADAPTSHIPVLILTARHGVDTRMRSFALRADDVLGKPFREEELRLRLTRMLDAQRRLRLRLRKEFNAGQLAVPLKQAGAVPMPKRTTVAQDMSEADQQLLAKLQRWLVTAYGKEGVKAADMAGAVGLELHAFQRKLQTLIGHSPITLLNSVRLREARRMLTETNLPIQEIAARCGYGSLQYFSRAFGSAEGVSPQAYRAAAQSESSQ